MEDNEIINKIKTYQTQLLRYCHHPDCNEIHECPKDHKWCDLNLDLDTAIAWTVTRLINNLIMQLEKQDSVDSKYRTTKEYLKKLDLIVFIIDHHRNRYENLNNILNDLFNSLKQFCLEFYLTDSNKTNP